jgi:hydroxyacyl-ACP dehydratase HTD2-like protein with hotdog domain
MSFRKEKKFRLSYSDMAKIKKLLLSAGMTTLHPARVINSCYFDTKNLFFYQESEEGVLPRKKIRIRWYDDDILFTKEVKISSIEGRYKYTNELSSVGSLEDIERLNFFDQEYGNLTPVLIVKYEREYHSLKGLRITFDKNIAYSDLRLNTKPTFKDSECVMEVKVPIDCGDDYIEEIIQHPTSRFSKYSRGLLHAIGG